MRTPRRKRNREVKRIRAGIMYRNLQRENDFGDEIIFLNNPNVVNALTGPKN